MAIKTTIQNLITSLIRSNESLIDKAEHADVEDALLLNSYGDVIIETHLINTITIRNPLLPSLEYNVFFCKQGRKVSIKGNLVNNSPNIIGEGLFLFEIIDPEYATITETNSSASALCGILYQAPVRVFVFQNKIYCEAIQAYSII